VSAKTSTTAAGLKYEFYQRTWDVLPDFNTLTPVKTGTSANVDISIRTPGVNDNFGFVWEGYINIPAPGKFYGSSGEELLLNTIVQFEQKGAKDKPVPVQKE